MLRTFTNYEPTAASVTEQLLSRFGPENIRHLEQLSPHFFRGATTSGTLILATVGEDGALIVREEEMLA